MPPEEEERPSGEAGAIGEARASGDATAWDPGPTVWDPPAEAKVLDLVFLGLPGAISTYFLDTPEPALVDPGPATSLEALHEALAGIGVGLGELRRLYLTHIHLDHAGASGQLIRDNPGITVYVHEDGAPHLVDPARLVASTRRTFGDAHDRLWGETLAIPEDRIRVWRPGERGPTQGIRAFHTPGHIAHHLAYLDERTGLLYSGDAMGIVLGRHTPTHPPTPPPSLDLAAWDRTLEALSSFDAEGFGATHFGFHPDVRGRAAELRMRLLEVKARVKAVLAKSEEDAERDQGAYEEEVRKTLSLTAGRERVDAYFDTFPAASDWAGVRFHLERTPGL